jgi:hypothetical protein
VPDREADHARLGVDDHAAAAGEIRREPDERDVDLPVPQGRSLAAPVEPPGHHPCVRVPPGELGAGPSRQLACAARFEADPQDLPEAGPFGHGRNPFSRRDRLGCRGQDLPARLGRHDPRRVPVEDPQPELGLEPLERV